MYYKNYIICNTCNASQPDTNSIQNTFKDMISSILTGTMSALVSALDKLNHIQCGENNHVEYAWSDIQREKILQLSFQLVRTDDSNKRQAIATRFVECFENGTLEDQKILIKLLAHTRDIEEGRGEYAVSFTIIKTLLETNNKYKELCVSLMRSFVGVDNSTNVKNQAPLGSWKDMKYLFNELQSCPQELVNIVNSQLKQDIGNMNNKQSCSLLAKWIPREKSKKFGWINKVLAMNYFERVGWGSSGWTKRATDKAQTYYRKLVSSLNAYIDTVQIKQCGQVWKMIDFDKVTSITMMKQRNAFLNANNLNNDDRIICRQHLLNYMEQVKQGNKEIKGKRTSMVDFVKAALSIQLPTPYSGGPDENTIHARFIINEAWKNNSKCTKSLENMIAMVDTSRSMEDENSQPLFSAMGLGLRVAAKSKLGKRILTFDANPTWINLDGCTDFVEEVHMVRNANWGMNTNFHKAMDLILDQIRINKLTADEVENLVLAVFSDMQFDKEDPHEDNQETPEVYKPSQYSIKQRPINGTVREILVQKFHNAGIEICGKGYKLPHILFWNLRSTSGFPELSYQPNVTMLSGYSPVLLNSFIEDGMVGLQESTPWGMLTKMLDKERYNVLETLIENHESR